MAFWNKVKDGAKKSWSSVRAGASDALEFASDKTDDALASLSNGGKFSKTDFLNAFVAAGVLMAQADGNIAQAEVDKVARFMGAHPILKNISESKRLEALQLAVEQAELGMLHVLAENISKLMDPLYDANGQIREELADEAFDELEQKARGVFKLAMTIKDEDAEVNDQELEMLEAVILWLGQEPTVFGLREDLHQNPPAIADQVMHG